MPALHVGMLWRMYAQGVGGVETGTLMDDELAKAMKELVV